MHFGIVGLLLLLFYYYIIALLRICARSSDENMNAARSPLPTCGKLFVVYMQSQHGAQLANATKIHGNISDKFCYARWRCVDFRDKLNEQRVWNLCVCAAVDCIRENLNAVLHCAKVELFE